MNSPSPATSPFARSIDALLAWLSIDPVAYRALVKAYLIMDFRNQQYGKSTATGAKALITPWFWVLGQNLIVGLLCSAVLFARVDVEFFTLAGISVSMLSVAASVLVEFNEIVLDPQDTAIIGHRPLPARTYAAARVTNLLVFLLMTSASLALFPAIVGAGLRDAGWGQCPAYVWGALVGDFLAAGAVLLGYLVLFRGRPAPEAQEICAWLQVLLILVLFYGGQFVLRDPQQKLAWIAYDLPAWIVYLPPMWLARGVTGLADGAGWGWALPVGTAVLLAAWYVILVRLSVAYALLQPGRPAWAPLTSRPLPIPGELGAVWMRGLTHAGEERASFWLTWTMLRRDSNLRMRCWPALAVVLAMLIMGVLTGQLANPAESPPAECVLTLGAMYLLAGSIPALLHQLRFSSDYPAAWMLATAPVSDSARFVAGIRKAVYVQFLIPMAGLMLVVFLCVWRDPVQALLHAGLAWCVAWGATCGCSAIQLRKIPFSAPLARGESFGPIAPLSAATAAIGMSLAALHAASAQRGVVLWCYAAGVAVAAVVAQCISDAALRRRPIGGTAP